MSFYGSISKYYDEIFVYDGSSADFVLQSVPALQSGGSAIDIGCGTGSLAADLVSRGCRVTAADFDEEMVNAAERKALSGNPVCMKMDMRTVKDHFPPASFDAVLCTGNTLANLPSSAAVLETVEGFSAILKEGGIAVIQILNYDYIIDKRIASLPPMKTDSFLFERRYDFEESGNILFTADFTGSDGEKFSNQISLYPLRKYELAAILLRAGFAEMNFFSGMSGEEFRDDALPLVVVAEKRSDCH